jgi:hypothetical protein
MDGVTTVATVTPVQAVSTPRLAGWIVVRLVPVPARMDDVDTRARRADEARRG